MKEYTFEYTKEGLIYLLFGSSFAIIGLGLILFATLFKNSLSPILITVLVISISVVFFFLNKHKVKKTGSAKLTATNLTFELTSIVHIAFDDLKYYYVHDGKNLITLTLGLKNGRKFIIGANNNFCDQDSLRVLLTDFQLNVKAYNSQNKTNIIHLESMFARTQTVYVLSTLTVLVILGFYFTKMPVMILPIGISFGLIGGWVRYFHMRSKNKLVDF